MKPLNINLYLPDGSPDGIVVVSSPNWTGECVKSSRLNINKVLQRYKETKVGIYFLFGRKDDKEFVYVGESEDVSSRIKQHLSSDNKSWFEDIVIFTASDHFLTKGHVKSIEYKLIEHIAKSIEYLLSNSNNGTESHLPEHMRADINNFFDYIVLIMPLLGFNNLFPLQSKGQINVTPEKDFTYLGARGLLLNNKFRVYKGSKISSSEVKSCNDSIKAMRKRLIETKIINPTDFTFHEDYDFNSPSSAGAVIYGGSVNGWTAWKNSLGKTLHEIERDTYINK